jgi:hypothetical protein
MPTQGEAAAVASLWNSAATLRGNLSRILPIYINATSPLLASHFKERSAVNGTRGAPLANLEKTAFELWRHEASFLMTFMKVSDDIIAGRVSNSEGGMALEKLVDDFQEQLAQQVLPELIAAARGFAGKSTSDAPGFVEPQGHASSDFSTVRSELAEFASTLPQFITHTMAEWPNQPACSLNMAEALMLLVDVSVSLQYSSADCEDEEGVLDCAVDVSRLFEKFAAASSAIADATFNCGSGDQTCLQATANGYNLFSNSAKLTIVAAADCVWPSLTPTSAFDWCAMNVVNAVQDLAKSAVSVDSVINICHIQAGGAPDMALKNLESSLRAEFGLAMPSVLAATMALDGGRGAEAAASAGAEGASHPELEAPELERKADNATGVDTDSIDGSSGRRLGCAGVNEVCWFNQQCCSARCSFTHHCRPVMR